MYMLNEVESHFMKALIFLTPNNLNQKSFSFTTCSSWVLLPVCSLTADSWTTDDSNLCLSLDNSRDLDSTLLVMQIKVKQTRKEEAGILSYWPINRLVKKKNTVRLAAATTSHKRGPLPSDQFCKIPKFSKPNCYFWYSKPLLNDRLP